MVRTTFVSHIRKLSLVALCAAILFVPSSQMYAQSHHLLARIASYAREHQTMFINVAALALFGGLYMWHRSAQSHACKPLAVTHTQPTLSQSQNDLLASFDAWKNSCATKLPRGHRRGRSTHSLVSLKQHGLELSCVTRCLQRYLDPKNNWLDNDAAAVGDHTFAPFVQRLIVPEGAQIAFKGDLHGDIHSLNRFIDDLKKKHYLDDTLTITKKDFYIVFLGDYTDRGDYGIEVLNLLWRLKCKNPTRVFMVRGNHEDVRLNDNGGLCDQLEERLLKNDHPQFSQRSVLYSRRLNLRHALETFYNRLPLAIYIGKSTNGHVDYIQCCHGGLEPGYDPHNLFAAPLDKLILFEKADKGIAAARGAWKSDCTKNQFRWKRDKDLDASYYAKSTFTTINGFMWSDFIVEDDPGYDLCISGRGCMLPNFGKKSTKKHFECCSRSGKYTLRCVLRGHQHTSGDAYEPMNARILNHDNLGHNDDCGAGKLWIAEHPEHKNKPGLLENVQAITFAVSPDIGFGPYLNQDSYGLLTTKGAYNAWRLTMHRINPV